ncbi:Isopentenyl-diphosphate delta-isomerase [compost metagenome]
MDVLYKVAQTFADWGISTVDSVLAAKEAQVPYEIWASGGVRNGLDVAKLIALGAKMVGLAQPFLEAALQNEKTSDQALEELVQKLELELKIALFCTGCRNIKDLQTKMVVQ